MGLGDFMKNIFGSSDATPADARQLSASSESALAVSLTNLPVGENGWITLDDAARLFSTQEREYAFGEIDDAGRARLENFVETPTHRSGVQFMPTEGRVYFTRRT
jgi:hypothetical protein